MRKNLKKNGTLNRTLKSIYLPEKTWKILDRHAQKLDRSTNWLMNKIIYNWITRRKKN